MGGSWARLLATAYVTLRLTVRSSRLFPKPFDLDQCRARILDQYARWGRIHIDDRRATKHASALVDLLQLQRLLQNSLANHEIGFAAAIGLAALPRVALL
jgi:hypothetical protein